jgi:hypothetical protein
MLYKKHLEYNYTRIKLKKKKEKKRKETKRKEEQTSQTLFAALASQI